MVGDSSSRQHPTNSLPRRELSCHCHKIVTKLRHEYLSCEVSLSSFIGGNFGDAEGNIAPTEVGFVGEPLSTLQLKEMFKDLVGQLAYRSANGKWRGGTSTLLAGQILGQNNAEILTGGRKSSQFGTSATAKPLSLHFYRCRSSSRP